MRLGQIYWQNKFFLDTKKTWEKENKNWNRQYIYLFIFYEKKSWKEYLDIGIVNLEFYNKFSITNQELQSHSMHHQILFSSINNYIPWLYLLFLKIFKHQLKNKLFIHYHLCNAPTKTEREMEVEQLQRNFLEYTSALFREVI